MAKAQPTSQPVPSSMVLGPVMHQGNRPPMAGQNAGFLGKAFDPFRVAEDPNNANFRVPGLAVPQDLSRPRLATRFDLLSQLNAHWQSNATGPMAGMQQLQRRAQGLLGSERVQSAFDLNKGNGENQRAVRAAQIRRQTLLLARRLVEIEVPLITVNWSKLNADQWDTHAKNYPRLRKLLSPFDRGLAALISDLDQRGKLDETLVVCLGEFGRTPKINKNAGRDHWPDCYSIVVAGGGMTRGTVFGASDRVAAYPTDDPIAPWDVAATMYHLLGIPAHTHVHDAVGRPFRLSSGRVVPGLLS